MNQSAVLHNSHLNSQLSPGMYIKKETGRTHQTAPWGESEIELHVQSWMLFLNSQQRVHVFNLEVKLCSIIGSLFYSEIFAFDTH